MTLTNITGISLPIAVWLAHDSYDFSAHGRKAISVTSLLKPVRQILLRERLKDSGVELPLPDVSDFIASRLGHSIHDSIEQAWKSNFKQSLLKLGYPQSLIDRVEINPESPTEGAIQVWLEQRVEREIGDYTLSGKFDMILDGVLQDFKSTSVYSWIMGSKDEDYQIQGSLYRWLNPERITSDHMNIQFIFTDWSRADAQRRENYPQQRVMEHRIELLSLKETEQWIRSRLSELEAAADLSEPQLPRCSDKDLWRSDPVFKYYKDPAKAQDPSARATRRYDTWQEAAAYKAEQGGVGTIVTILGKPKACSYCACFPICSQKDEYEHD